MFMIKAFTGAVAALALAVTATQPALSQGKKGVKVGVLKCNVAQGVGFVFGSSRKVSCVYVPGGKADPEHYTGEINKWGVDIGYIKRSTMIWAVLAPSTDVRAGALAGSYGGISADVAAGVGVGANALIGGFQKSIALQPVSIEGIKGVNIAAGIASLTLRKAK